MAIPFLALFCVESVQCNHQLRMDVYTHPELTDIIMCYGAAGGNGRRALRMYRNGFQTEITLTTQCLLAFISALDKMGLFILGALVEDLIKQGHLSLRKCLRELATTPQLEHVPLPMPWVKISLQCCKPCKNKTSMHTTSRKYKDWGPTTSHLVYDLSSDF